MANRISFEDRKALLQAQSELNRLKIAASCCALRDTVMPRVDDYRGEKKSLVSIGLRLLLLALGASRAKRLQRGAAWGLVLWRLWRYWNKGR
ncbi:MAG: hypothetical protein FWC38_03300 [Proteobacteria bacterium]|nr:hypothetical protein [Pseudomonadota bacterium]MCL2307254.1 hypothetical protein [Pseudomonadota bacterium]